MDLTRPESDSLRKSLDGVTAVFHLAGITSSAVESGYSRVNVGTTRTMIDATREASPGAHFVFCSSIAAGGPGNGRHTMNETDPPEPISEYGRSKLAAEHIVETSGLRHSIIRPAPVYGPRDSGIFSMFRLVSYGIAPYVATRMQVLSLVHVSDLVKGMISAATPHASGVYYMTDGSTHTWDDIIKEISKVLGKTPRYVAVSPGLADFVAKAERLRGIVMGGKPMITPDRLIELSRNEWTCSDLRARLDLDYESQVELADGIKSTAEWYRSNGWLAR
jgi:dihydroflavonol-4-reductase